MIDIDKIKKQGARDALWKEIEDRVAIAGSQLNAYQQSSTPPYDDIIDRLKSAIQGLEHLKTLA